MRGRAVREPVCAVALHEMPVRVDEPRHHGLATGVDRAARAIGGRALADRDDLAVADDDRAALDHAARAVQHPAVRDHEILRGDAAREHDGGERRDAMGNRRHLHVA